MMTLWNLDLPVSNRWYAVLVPKEKCFTSEVILNAKKNVTESSVIANFDIVENCFHSLRVKGKLKCFAEKQYFTLVWIYTIQKVRQVNSHNRPHFLLSKT